MAVKTDVYDGVAVVSVEGDFVEDHAVTAREAVQQILDHRRLGDVVVDLSACDSVGSDGLETLLWAKTRCEEVYGRFKLAGCDPILLKILEMTRLRHRFECCDSVESALKLMRA